MNIVNISPLAMMSMEALMRFSNPPNHCAISLSAKTVEVYCGHVLKCTPVN